MFGGVFSLRVDNTVINIWRCHLFLHLLATFVCVYLLIILNFPRKRRFFGVLFLLPPCPSEHASFLHFFLHSLSKIVVKISLGNKIVQHQIIRWSLVQRSLSVWEPSCPRAAVFFFAFILAKKIKRIKTSLHHGEYVLQAWKTRSSVVERQFCLFVVFFVPWRNKKNYPRTFCYFCFHVFEFFPFSNWKKFRIISIANQEEFRSRCVKISFARLIVNTFVVLK